MGIPNDGDIAGIDANRRASITAKSSSVDSDDIVALEADPITKRLLTNTTVSGTVTVDGAEATDYEGGKVTVGTSEVELTFTGTTQAIQIESDIDNTGTIYVGKTGVLADGTNAVSRLEAGDILSLDLNDDEAAVYVISDTADQVVYKLALI